MTRGSFLAPGISELPSSPTFCSLTDEGINCGCFCGLWLFLFFAFAPEMLRFVPEGEDVGVFPTEPSPPTPGFFLSRSVIEDGGIGAACRELFIWAMYCAEFASNEWNMATVRSSHRSVDPWAVSDCLPPRLRFFVAFSNYENDEKCITVRVNWMATFSKL